MVEKGKRIMKPRWPRGKYNNQRIEGFGIKFQLRVFSWYWKPRIHWKYGEYYFLWLCFALRYETEYDFL